MADIITLTAQPVRLSVANGAAQRQAIYLATDMGGYDIVDWDLTVVAVEGTSPTLKVNIVTGLQAQTEDGWVTACAFNSGNAITATNSYVASVGPTSGNPLLRYVRWDVTAFGGTSAFATLWIRGVARRLA
jgi:hypothetical protein